ncbi:MAG: 50S ribosome-binding GTPase [Candidatus Thermoplasmatota archaeon]|nr:50S ribosome-binding GTPase [Candidatus Thermoplasmatota archaeon]
MFRELPEILESQELIDRAFKKTDKVNIVDRDAFYRKKKTIIAKTDSFCTTIITTLESYVKKFPSINNMHPFFQELLAIKFDVDELKKSLGGVDWARKTSYMVFTTQITQLKRSQNIEFLKQKQKEIYGRVTSIVKQVKKELKTLKDARDVFISFPDIEDIPTVVIAGFPNVGKSSLLRCLSSAKPEIAQYPFTTKELVIGHMFKQEKYDKTKIQIIDTPGLLDRPLSERNKIERQAISAVKNLADIVVFIFDPTETCGYRFDDQKHLFSQMQEMFKDSEFIIVENKADFKKTSSKNIKVSCESKEGIDVLINEIISKI